jgi:hypothetical protein
MDQIHYRSGYKYQLAKTYHTRVDICPEKPIVTEYIVLGLKGKLIINQGYAWDGASGPTLDTKDSMRGSLIHDALYQLIRMDLLKPEERHQADRELKRACIEDGMNRIRAELWYNAVRFFAKSAADKRNIREIKIAP